MYIHSEKRRSKYWIYLSKNSNVKSRIDYIFTDSNVIHTVNNFQVKTSPAPDHKALQIIINRSLNRRGPSYWKLNTSVLTEPNTFKA